MILSPLDIYDFDNEGYRQKELRNNAAPSAPSADPASVIPLQILEKNQNAKK